jgi:hypothetical protein
MGRTERLEKWIESLDEKQKDKIILKLIEFAIDQEEVSFYKSAKKPYWSNSGEDLDE